MLQCASQLHITLQTQWRTLRTRHSDSLTIIMMNMYSTIRTGCNKLTSVDVTIAGYQQPVLPDTESSLNLMSKDTYLNWQGATPIEKTSVSVYTLMGQIQSYR